MKPSTDEKGINITMGLGDRTYEDLYKEADHRMQPIAEFLELKKYADKRILDDGCGCGWLTDYLQKNAKGANVYGIDPVPSDIEFARKKNKRIEYKVSSGENLPFRDDFFDLVTSHQILEHVKSPEKYLSELARVLKRDGTVYLSTPNRLLPFDFHHNLPLISWFPAKFLRLFMNLRYERLYTVCSVKRMLEKKGFVIEQNMMAEMVKNPRKVYFEKSIVEKVHKGYNIFKKLGLGKLYLSITTRVLPQFYMIRLKL